MEFVLWIIAVILVVWGIVLLVRRNWLPGAIAIVAGLLIGPGG
ncbi:MAG: GPGG-motif small membrane protein, partial [Jiangellaceae bacterium]